MYLKFGSGKVFDELVGTSKAAKASDVCGVIGRKSDSLISAALRRPFLAQQGAEPGEHFAIRKNFSVTVWTFAPARILGSTMGSNTPVA